MSFSITNRNTDYLDRQVLTNYIVLGILYRLVFSFVAYSVVAPTTHIPTFLDVAQITYLFNLIYFFLLVLVKIIYAQYNRIKENNNDS